MKQLVAALVLCAAASSAGAAQVTKPLPQRLGQERAVEQVPGRKIPTLNKPILQPGAYSLVLTPTRIGGKPAPKTAKPIMSSVTVSQKGRIMSVENADGLALSGAASGARFTLAGQSGDGKLTLTGSAANSGATGDFKLTFRAGPQVAGNFELASSNHAGGFTPSYALKPYTPPKPKPSGTCNWWCTVKGWFTL